MIRTRLAIATVLGVLAAGAVAVPVAAQDKGTLKVGITLPLSGAVRADGGPAERGAQLAIDQANEAGGIGGYTLETVVLDHAVSGQYNAAQGAADMQTLANDVDVIGVVGPYNSDVAAAQIPIGNAAGLLQCSPANTRVALTQPPDALTLRPTNPDKIAYIRVAASDLFQGPGVADYAFNKLGLRHIFVLDDQTGFGVGVADTFQSQFELYGGTITRQGAGSTTVDFTGIVSQIPPEVDGVFYGGVTSSGGGLFQKQLRQAGNQAVFLGPDGIKNGAGTVDGSQIQIAGVDAAAGSVASVAAIGDFEGKADFDAAYIEHFKDAPDMNEPGAYSGPAHACATIILDSLRAVLEASPDADRAAIREGVRAYATDSANVFETVLGPESFDENGDTSLKFISFYVVDPALADGAGDWAFVEQRQYGG
jgi:branched-chain amino acid transport system substrate-binding protein